MKIAIQGETGSFHAEATSKYYSTDFEIMHLRYFEDVFLSVKEGVVDSGLVAIENSLYGSINEVYDLLNRHSLVICGEIILRIEHFLLAVPGATLSSIKEIYSQAPALAQCETYLDKHLPTADRIDYFDTAAGAKFVSEKKMSSLAAIASRHASEIYNLNILASNIETDENNYTRFVILGKEQTSVKLKNPKTSIMFSTNDKPGALYNVLKLFAEADINLTKLESRPMFSKAWQYFYYLDFDGNIRNDKILQIIEQIKTITSDLRILGCYEADSLSCAKASITQ